MAKSKKRSAKKVRLAGVTQVDGIVEHMLSRLFFEGIADVVGFERESMPGLQTSTTVLTIVETGTVPDGPMPKMTLDEQFQLADRMMTRWMERREKLAKKLGKE